MISLDFRRLFVNFLRTPSVSICVLKLFFKISWVFPDFLQAVKGAISYFKVFWQFVCCIIGLDWIGGSGVSSAVVKIARS